MKRFHTWLHETFDQPYPLRRGAVTTQPGVGAVGVSWTARTPDGGLLEIEVYRNSLDPQAPPRKYWQVDFTVDGTEYMRDTGHATRTLATVLAAVREFLRWHTREWGEPPQQLALVSKAAEPSRERVYAAMARRSGAALGYRVHSVGPGEGWGTQNTVITLTRR